MQDARARWAAFAVLVVVAAGCGASGGSSRATDVRADATSAVARRVASTTTSTTTTPTVAPAVTPPPTAAPPAPAPTAPPVVSVSVAAMQRGSFSQSDGGACSNVSSQQLAQGLLALRRSGPSDQPLVVRYAVSGTAADFTPLPGVATIPAGADGVTIPVVPRMTFGPAPQHVHRSSSVTVTVQDDAAYDIGTPGSAAVTLTFDVDVYGCDAPTDAAPPVG